MKSKSVKIIVFKQSFLLLKKDWFLLGAWTLLGHMVVQGTAACQLSHLHADVIYMLMPQFASTDHCRLVGNCGAKQECKSNATHGYCACIQGFYKPSASSTCEVDCSPSFCLNNGKCERGPNYRVCRCASGYSGNRCEKEGNNVGLIVGLSVAGLLLIIIIGIIVWKKNQRKYNVNKGIQLDNTACAKNSPDYPLKTYSNPRAYGEVSGSNKSTPASVRAFSNKVAVDSVHADEQDALKEDEKDV